MTPPGRVRLAAIAEILSVFGVLIHYLETRDRIRISISSGLLSSLAPC